MAVSRAECLAVLVHTPRLLDADCRTLEATELVDGPCRFVEMARPRLAELPERFPNLVDERLGDLKVLPWAWRVSVDHDREQVRKSSADLDRASKRLELLLEPADAEASARHPDRYLRRLLARDPADKGTSDVLVGCVLAEQIDSTRHLRGRASRAG